MASDWESCGDEIGNEVKVRLLRELAAALTRLGIGAELLDSPALAVSTPTPGVCVWVFVTGTGQSFMWQRSDSSHPVEDIAGAAIEIAKWTATQNGLANGGVRS